MENTPEPASPGRLLVVDGDSPIAQALAAFGPQLDLDVRTEPPEDFSGVQAVVVSSHGPAEIPLLTAALGAGVPYIALVASRKRGAAVLDSLSVDEAAKARIHTPAGLDIGARGAPEIAVSILAQLISERAGV